MWLLARFGRWLIDLAGEAVEQQVESKPRKVVMELTSGRIVIEGVLRLDFPEE